MIRNELLVFVMVSFFVNSVFAETIGQRISERIQTENISVSIPFLDLGIGETVSIPGHAHLRITPNSDLLTYSRSEQITFGLNLDSGIDSSVFSIGNQNAITGEFVRQFPSQKEALNVIKNPPYVVRNNNRLQSQIVPFNATNARRLNTQDYFRFQIRTAFVLSAQMVNALTDINVQLGASYILYGDFQYEIYKKSNNRILVRASSLKNRQFRGSFGFGRGDGLMLRLFKIDEIDQRLSRIVPSKILEVNIFEQTRGDLFAVEYEFNLNSEEAALAYNQMVNPRSWPFLSALKVLNPIRGASDAVVDTLASVIDEAEELSQADAHQSRESDIRVRRIAKSHTNYVERSSGVRINFRLITAQNSESSIEQNIRLITDPLSQNYQNYRIATSTMIDNAGGWLTFGSENKTRTEANVLFDLDANMRIKKFREMNFSVERTDKKLTRRESKNILGHIYKMVPGIFHKVANFQQITDSMINQRTYFRLDVVIDEQAFGLATMLSDSEKEKVIRDYIKIVIDDQTKRYFEYGQLNLDSFVSNDRDCREASRQTHCLSVALQGDINRIVSQTLAIFSLGQSALDHEQRWRLYLRLQNNRLFKVLGAGLFIRLLEQAAYKQNKSFEKLAYFNLTTRSGQNAREQNISFGNLERPPFFTELLKVRDRILNRQFDIRFFEN